MEDRQTTFLSNRGDLLSMIRKVIQKSPNSSKKLVPQFLKDRIKQSSLYLKDRAEVTNVYHCCTHKSASQWVRGLLGDPITFQHTGLETFHYQTAWLDGYDSRPYNERQFSRSFPRRMIATPLYLDYSMFEKIPKPEKYRAFFVLRDPRDVVVSWYFSMKNTHQVMGKIRKHRKNLQELSKSDGLCYAIEYLSDFGLFQSQISWMGSDDPNVRVFKYEDLTGPNQFQAIKTLFNHCTIPIPDSELRNLLYRHGFEASEGREKGKEDRSSHRRKGVAGDWKNHFDSKVRATFKDAVGSLPQEMVYCNTNK